ncbi:hypothetical protein ACLESD_19770 [Pyxidicoccus sp. 3LFB2]
MSPQRRLELEFAEAIGHLEISLRHHGHEQFRAEMLRFLRRMQARANTSFVRREMARRVAERILSRACMLPEPAATLALELKRMTRLGYSSLDRRVHIAAMLGRWIQLGKEDSPVVRPFIADAASRVKRMRKGRNRKAQQESIERAMVRTGMKPG